MLYKKELFARVIKSALNDSAIKYCITKNTNNKCTEHKFLVGDNHNQFSCLDKAKEEITKLFLKAITPNPTNDIIMDEITISNYIRMLKKIKNPIVSIFSESIYADFIEIPESYLVDKKIHCEAVMTYENAGYIYEPVYIIGAWAVEMDVEKPLKLIVEDDKIYCVGAFNFRIKSREDMIINYWRRKK